FAQQRVDLLPGTRGHQIVRRLEIFNRDLVGRNERLDLDRLRCLHVGTAEVLVGEYHIFAPLVFVSLDDVVPRDFLAAALAVAFVADRRKIAFVDQRELELAFFLGGVKLDRYADEPEGDGAFPESTSHGWSRE